MLKKLFIIAAIGISVAVCNTSSAATAGAKENHRLAPAGDIESAKVGVVAISIPMAAEFLRYDRGEAALASSVVVDFTSVWGGTPSTMTFAELMAAWRALGLAHFV